MYLQWNLDVNGVADRVTLVPYGIGPKAVHPLPYQWQLSIPSRCGSSLPDYIRADGEKTLTISKFKTMPYKDLKRMYDIGTVDLLKLDCEGCEYFADLDDVF